MHSFDIWSKWLWVYSLEEPFFYREEWGSGAALSNQIFDCSPTKLLNSKVTKSKVKPNARPVVKTPQGTLLHYIEQLHDEITKMVNEDFIEGLLEKEEQGTYISNLVTYKK